MKRQFKVMTGILIIVLISYLYAHINRVHDIYKRDVDISAAANNTTLINDIIQQEFVSGEATLDGVRIKPNVRGGLEGISFAFTLDHLATGERVAEGSISAEHLSGSQFLEFYFDTVENAAGQKYLFTTYIENERDQELMGFLYDSTTAEYTSLIINGEERNGTLILRTVTSRFDLETFVVTIAFFAYIVLFMKYLYKLFK